MKLNIKGHVTTKIPFSLQTCLNNNILHIFFLQNYSYVKKNINTGSFKVQYTHK